MHVEYVCIIFLEVIFMAREHSDLPVNEFKHLYHNYQTLIKKITINSGNIAKESFDEQIFNIILTTK